MNRLRNYLKNYLKNNKIFTLCLLCIYIIFSGCFSFPFSSEIKTNWILQIIGYGGIGIAFVYIS